MKIFIVALLINVFSAAASGQDGNATVQQLLRKYADIKHPERYADFYRSLFDACRPSDLEVLLTHENDSIATQSAWQTVNLSVPVNEGPKVYRPDSQKLVWFLGFLEGRNRIVAPEWWRDVVTDARANRRNNIYSGNPKVQPYHGSGIEFVHCPTDASVDETKGAVTYRRGDESIVVPEELLERSDSGKLWCSISCCFTDDRCYVATHDNRGYPHSVACMDRKAKKIVWESRACGCWWWSTTGHDESWVSVVTTKDGRVFVFGAAGIGFYVHGFRSSDGKTLVCFSNNY